MSNKWIKWKGGKCPVERGTLVDVKYRDGDTSVVVPALMTHDKRMMRAAYSWDHHNIPVDIVAYRLCESKGLSADNLQAPLEKCRCGFVLFAPDSIRTGECRDCKAKKDLSVIESSTDPKLNPKHGPGSRKFRMSGVPACVLGEIGVAMTEGVYKYGAFNYRSCKIDASTYYDATLRHLMSWWEGEDIDPDTGLSHITKAITSLVVLRDSMINSTISDNRPPKAPKTWVAGLNAATEVLTEKYEALAADRKADEYSKQYD